MKAVSCLAKDREALLARSVLPAEHWAYLQTTNPIKSTFARLLHRTDRIKGASSQTALLSMLFKLATTAEGSFQRLKGFDWLGEVIRGAKFAHNSYII